MLAYGLGYAGYTGLMVFRCELVLFSWINAVAGAFPIVLPYSRGVVGLSREYASYLIANSFISSSESGRHSM